MGSIPFGFILTKIFLKKDIREIGSGNIGATNALRTGNKLSWIQHFILDIVKAIIPVIYVKMNYPELIYIASLCAFLGHVFPIWLKFKGGKGVATYVGILFSINILLGLIFVVSWGVNFFNIQVLFPFINRWIFINSSLSFNVTDEKSSVIFFITMFVLIFFTHRENIIRLKNKEESKTKIY